MEYNNSYVVDSAMLAMGVRLLLINCGASILNNIERTFDDVGFVVGIAEAIIVCR